MFKKIIAIGIFLVLTISIVACSGVSIPGATSSAQKASQTQSTTNSQLTVQEKLGVGILKLEETSLAVTADQATTLLPLWKAIKSLGADQNASQAEVQALYQQVEESLTSEQVQAIEQLTWTQDDLNTMMQQYGAQAAQSSTSTSKSTSSTSAASAAQGQPPDAGAMAGGGPGGMPGGDMTGAMPVDAQTGAQVQTTQSAQPAVNTTMNLNLLFADSVVTLLKQSAGV
jgi:hypothetical protein